MASFIFGGDTGETPESIARQREVANALWAQQMRQGAPRTIGDGIALVGQALSRRASLSAAEEAEQKNLAANNEILSALLGAPPAGGAGGGGLGGVGSDAVAGNAPSSGAPPTGGFNPAALAAISSPYASEGTRTVAKLLLEQEMKKRAAANEAFTLGPGQQRFDGAGNVIAMGPPKVPDAAGEYGLNPVWGTGPDGQPALVQLGKDGTPIQPKLPQGFNIARDPIKVDAGTQTVLLDPQTRQVIGSVPKDVAGAASQEAIGKGAGEARVALPGAEGMARAVGEQVTSLKNDPYLPNMLGPINSRLPNLSSDAARVQSKMDQIGGGAFLQARQMLKGGGAITDFESAKAEAAMIRMNDAQSEQDYKAALDDFNSAVQSGIEKMRAQAGGAPAYVSPINPDGTKNQSQAPRRRYNPATGMLE